MASPRRSFPILERWDLPSVRESSFETSYPGRFLQGPEENSGLVGLDLKGGKITKMSTWIFQRFGRRVWIIHYLDCWGSWAHHSKSCESNISVGGLGKCKSSGSWKYAHHCRFNAKHKNGLKIYDDGIVFFCICVFSMVHNHRTLPFPVIAISQSSLFVEFESRIHSRI